MVKAVEVGKKAAATLLAYVQHQFLSNSKSSFHTY